MEERLAAEGPPSGPAATRLAGSWLPAALSLRVLAVVDVAADGLFRAGVSANAVTLASLILTGAGAALLALDRFGWAAGVLAVALLGDALDGAVARRSGAASVGGALLDAASDRYGELLVLGGLAVRFHVSVPWLVLLLAAIAGAFMVSYGSAKAEGVGARVPPSTMRRAERAVCLWAGIAGTAALEALSSRGVSVPGGSHLPLLVAVGAIALVGNASAVRRLRIIARTELAERAPRVTRAPAGASLPGPRPPEPVRPS